MLKPLNKKNTALSFLLLFSIIFSLFMSTAAVDSPHSAPTEQGIWTEYYRGTKLGTFVTGKKENSFNFSWGSGNIPPGLSGYEQFSMLASGYIKAPQTGEYTIYSNLDDGAKIWLDGDLVINDAGPHVAKETSVVVTLEANKYYELKIEYYNGELDGTAQLLWKKPGGQKELIPSENFYMPVNDAAVSLKLDGSKIYAEARMQNTGNSMPKLIIESYNESGVLIDSKETVRTNQNQLIWESVKMEYTENTTYKAYAKDSNGNTVSNEATKIYGADMNMDIDPGVVTGDVSPLLYGACMEDVNHELYGGIWSQLIFGESFAEPVPSIGRFYTAGGVFESQLVDGKNQITVQKQDAGPKLMISGTECEAGEFSADVLLESGEGPAGFIIKVRNPSSGADSFTGYEIGLSNNQLRVGRHDYDYNKVGDYSCNAPINTWANLRVVMTRNTMTVFVNNTQVYSGNCDFAKGEVGLRAWNCSAKYKNIKFAKDGGTLEEIEIPDFNDVESVSGMWNKVERGTASGSFEFIKNGEQFKDSQSQRITYDSGTGAVGVYNMSLNRKGINFEKDKNYEGYFYAKSLAPVTAYVVFESADGSVKYAEKAIPVSGGWKKYSFDGITPDTKDKAGRITIELRSAGTLDLGYVFAQYGEWGRYKGLPVRKDVAEQLENQNLTVLRFGGCMAQNDLYKWKNMLGDPEDRPTYDGWWYKNYSSYGFGIIDFLDLCEALGIPGVPNFNQTETPQDMADFIEFAIGTDPSSQWVQKRISMGHPDPYDLPYIQYGNEQNVSASLAARFNKVATAVWDKEKSITGKEDIILIVGDFDYKDVITDPYNFTGSASGLTTLANHKTILEHAINSGNREVWFDIHFWTNNAENSYGFFDAGISLYNQLKSICPGTKVKLPIFELNADRHTFDRALGNAYATNRGERLSDIFPIICSANSLQVDGHNDDGWDQGLVFMDNDSAWLQAPGYVTQMAADAYQPHLISAEVDKVISVLDYTVTKSADGKTIVVKFVNLTDSDQAVRLNLKEFTGNKNRVTVTSLTAESDKSSNPTDNRNNIVPVSVVTDNLVKRGSAVVSIAKRSYTVVKIEALSGLSDIDKEVLEEAVKSAELLKSFEYSPKTWKPFSEELESANDVLDDNDATQDQVNVAVLRLNNAVNALYLLHQGDVNGDTNIDITDILAVRNVLTGSVTDPDTVIRADVNNDRERDIADMHKVRNIIMGTN